jgi:hypothetical protein
MPLPCLTHVDNKHLIHTIIVYFISGHLKVLSFNFAKTLHINFAKPWLRSRQLVHLFHFKERTRLDTNCQGFSEWEEGDPPDSEGAAQPSAPPRWAVVCLSQATEQDKLWPFPWPRPPGPWDLTFRSRQRPGLESKEAGKSEMTERSTLASMAADPREKSVKPLCGLWLPWKHH